MLLSLYFSEKDVWDAFWETQLQSLGQEDPLEKEMGTHSNILAWRIPWIENSIHGGLQSIGSQKVRHN